jgi:hypothetical protein
MLHRHTLHEPQGNPYPPLFAAVDGFLKKKQDARAGIRFPAGKL